MTDDVTNPDGPACISCGGRPLKVKKRRLCDSCYCRWQRYGDPAGGGPKLGMTPLERFNYYVPDQSDPAACWLWTGPTLGREVCDYGRLYIGEGAEQRYVLVHRWSYEHFVKPIPDGLEIDHVKARGCVSTLCCNPAHLEPVPHKINIARGDGVGARNAAKECCPKCGADYTLSPAGKRECRPCVNARMREWLRETGRTTGEGSGSRNRGKEWCDNGHEYTPENTYTRPATASKPGGGRDCKICRKERKRKAARRLRGLDAA